MSSTPCYLMRQRSPDQKAMCFETDVSLSRSLMINLPLRQGYSRTAHRETLIRAGGAVEMFHMNLAEISELQNDFILYPRGFHLRLIDKNHRSSVEQKVIRALKNSYAFDPLVIAGTYD